jgi:hypothetical protein
MTKQHPNDKNKKNNKHKNKNKNKNRNKHKKNNSVGVAKPDKDLNDQFMIPKQQTFMTQWLKTFVPPEPEKPQPPVSVPHLLKKVTKKRLPQKKPKKVILGPGLYLSRIEGGRPAHELPARYGIDATYDSPDWFVCKFGRSNDVSLRVGTQHPPDYNNNPDDVFCAGLDVELQVCGENFIKRYFDCRNMRLKNAYHEDGRQCHELVILNRDQCNEAEAELKYITYSLMSLKEKIKKNLCNMMLWLPQIPETCAAVSDASVSDPSKFGNVDAPPR